MGNHFTGSRPRHYFVLRFTDLGMDLRDAVERAALSRHNARLVGKGRGRRVVEGYLVRPEGPCDQGAVATKEGRAVMASYHSARRGRDGRQSRPGKRNRL